MFRVNLLATSQSAMLFDSVHVSSKVLKLLCEYKEMNPLQIDENLKF